MVDFTIAAGIGERLEWYAGHGVHAVVGTSGISPAVVEQARELFGRSDANAVIAPNFALGAALLTRFCELAAPVMDGVEIVELHHDGKVDSPSGTALHTAEQIALAREAAGAGPFNADPTTEVNLADARGGLGPGRDPDPRGAPARPRRPRGGHLRGGRPDPHDPTRLLRPALVHARGAAGHPKGGGSPGADRRARPAARALSMVTGADTPDPRERILEATYACVARWGLSKTSIEDVTKEAGLSRSTVYRYFPGGRDELISATVGWEYDRFFARLYDEVKDADSLEEVMERGLTFAHRSITRHEVLQRVLQTEPELLLPAITVKSEATVALVAAFLTPYLERHELAPGVGVAEAADFLARMALSYMTAAGRWDLEDPDQVARLVRAELPGRHPAPAS